MSPAGTGCVLSVVALLWGSVLVEPGRAQPFPGSQPSPRAEAEPYLHVGAMVHKLLVQGVESDGTLWLDLEGRSIRVRLEDVQLPAANTAAGMEARKLLGRFVGRWIRFAFHGEVAHDLTTAVRDDAAPRVTGYPEDPSSEARARRGRRVVPAYGPLVDLLLEGGLGRYCPGPGKTSSGLARLEQEARSRGVGIWQTPGGALPCAPAPR